MKISLQAQIEETEREIALRAKVYPNQVRRGLMRQSVADHHIERMLAVKSTLEWLAENETAVRAYVTAKKDSQQGAANHG